jgi:hypothetical protein
LGKAVRQVEIDVLDDAAALALLESLVGKERIQQDLESTKKLCTCSNFSPRIELVGRYLDRKLDLSLAEMQQRLGEGLNERSLLRLMLA